MKQALRRANPVVVAGVFATARARSDDVTALVVPDAAHFEVIAPGSNAWPVVRDAVLSILGR